ncbi:hypothetical protein B0O99DRAFT_682525 [Bisporella sp. PMI_857]|nr:hypothetical protein B0O99DRAFT_682525 [Bisporella sp. PMI_857]
MLLTPRSPFNSTLQTAALVLVSIQSAYFPGSYLRIDGRDVVSPSGPGGGIVNCQNFVGAYEQHYIETHPSGAFSILSHQFANVYLRMDGSKVLPGVSYPDGSPTVNAQAYTAGAYEQFRWEWPGDGYWVIASATQPGRYLRMKNVDIQGGPSGAGVVNIQNGAGPFEKFVITIL